MIGRPLKYYLTAPADDDDELFWVSLNRIKPGQPLFAMVAEMPVVILSGPPDPPLGPTWPLDVVARSQDEPSGGGNPIWIPQRVGIVLAEHGGTLTLPWTSGKPVLRQDYASHPLTAVGGCSASAG
jgi:hypothetical protein